MNTITYKGGPYDGTTQTVRCVHTKVAPVNSNGKGIYVCSEAKLTNEADLIKDGTVEKQYEQTATWSTLKEAGLMK